MTDYLKDSQPLNQHGHFPGCAVHGCEVTRCAEYRARDGFPRRHYITHANDLEELARLRAMHDGLARLHVDVQRWIAESDDRPNLRAAEHRIVMLLARTP